jgi:tetratricopeptide (TPR) repeat protein
MAITGRAFRVGPWVACLAILACLGLLVRFYYQYSAPPALAAAARAAYDRSDYAKAAELARARLKLEGGDVEALRLLARSSVRLGRDGPAIAIYNDRMTTDQLEAEDLFLLGLASMRQGNEDLTEKLWSKAADERPDLPELLLWLANLMARRQRLDEAMVLAKRVAQIPGWEAAGLLLLGTNQVTIEDYARAAESLQKGLGLDPKATRAPLDAAIYHKLLARCLLILGQPKEADHWLEAVSGSASGSTDVEAAWLASRSALQQGQIDRAKAELARSGSYRTEHPLEPEPSPYTGQAKCTPCHTDIGRTHAETRHARTFHHGNALLALPRPPGPLKDPDNPKVTHTLLQQGKVLKAETRIDDRVFQMIVDYAFGTSDRYVTMVGRDGEGRYRALRNSFYQESGKPIWGRTAGDAGMGTDDQSLRGQPIHIRDGVVRCLHCHTTNPREFRNAEKVDTGPEAADAGIGCERCHGPGANHVAAVAADFPDRAIVNVTVDQGEAATNQCRSCHTVGDPAEIERQPEDPRFVRSPGVTMTLSRCFTESSGALNCLTCHDPHRDSERSASFYEKKCLQCHAGDAIQGTPGDGGHAPGRGSVCKVNPTRDCLGCHMPKVPMPILHASLTDHYIRVHKAGDLKK